MAVNLHVESDAGPVGAAPCSISFISTLPAPTSGSAASAAPDAYCPHAVLSSPWSRLAALGHHGAEFANRHPGELFGLVLAELEAIFVFDAQCEFGKGSEDKSAPRGPSWVSVSMPSIS